MLDRYVAQVRLLLSLLPDIAGETAFALKGGTAINLFYRDMPRLSVDVDLPHRRTWVYVATVAGNAQPNGRPTGRVCASSTV